MKSTWKVGLLIAVFCCAWQMIMVGMGWLTNPRTLSLFYLVILIQIVILIWGMRQTATDNKYGKQLLFGTLASAIAAVFIFAYSLFLMTVLAPNLIEEIKAMQTAALKAAGRPEAEIGIAMALQTPLFQACQGFLGTIVTGFLASAVIAIFVRKK
jgi:hypothetical protein